MAATNILCCCLLVFCALLPHKGLSRPNRSEDPIDDVFDEYPNDDDNGNTSDYSGEVEEEYTGPPPEFTSQPLNLEVKPGESVTLPCKYKFPESAGNITEAMKPVVLWLNGTATLYLSATKVSSDPRISLDRESLILRNLQPEDSGHYICQVSSTALVNLTHTLNVFHQAKIVSISPRIKDLVLREEDPLYLSCQATGYPKPTINWLRKKQPMPDGSHKIAQENITYHSVGPDHSGIYQCIASNGYGNPDTKDINVIVNYAPKVNVENKTVISGEEYESVLVCKVNANPRAQVQWIKDNAPVEQSNNIKLSHEGNMYKITIDKTQSTDFGDYTCRASNEVGVREKVVHLTRQPSKPQLTSHALADGGNSIMFEWTLESFAPISQYELQFRNKMNNEWKNEFPEVTNAEGNVYIVKHKLHSQPPGEYEAILISRNNFGESKSDPHTFHLTDKIGIAEPRGEAANNKAESFLPSAIILTVAFAIGVLFL